MKILIMEAFTIFINQQNGASYSFEDNALKINVSQTDEYISVDSDQSFDLSLGYAFSVKYKSQSNRGHFTAGLGDGNSKERLGQGDITFQMVLF